MFIDAEDVTGKVMEVVLTCVDGKEYVYWVDLEKRPADDDDEYDWAIEKAREFHTSAGLPECPEDTEEDTYAEALEPFSRDDSEFTWVR